MIMVTIYLSKSCQKYFSSRLWRLASRFESGNRRINLLSGKIVRKITNFLYPCRSLLRKYTSDAHLWKSEEWWWLRLVSINNFSLRAQIKMDKVCHFLSTEMDLTFTFLSFFQSENRCSNWENHSTTGTSEVQRTRVHSLKLCGCYGSGSMFEWDEISREGDNKWRPVREWTFLWRRFWDTFENKQRWNVEQMQSV